MSAKRSLLLFFALVGAQGLASGYFGARAAALPKALEFVFLVLSTVSIYLWYYHDANERRYQRSALLGGAVVMLSVIAIPCYLVKSRPSGQKGKALLLFLGCVVLVFVISVVTTLPFELGR